MKALILPLLIAIGAIVGIYYTLENQRVLDELLAKIEKTQAENVSVTATGDQRQKELDDAKEALKVTEGNFIAISEDLRKEKGNTGTLNGQIQQANQFLAVYERQKEEHERVSEEVANLAQTLGESFSIESIEQAKNDMEGRRDDRIAKVDELDVLITAAKKSIEANTAELARQVEREERRQMKITRSQMEAVVTGVNQDWGFIVIGAGSNSGFTPQSALLIERDGRMICKVRPSSIEPTQTIAEINFDSLLPGVRVQPGDKVIFENPTVE